MSCFSLPLFAHVTQNMKQRKAISSSSNINESPSSLGECSSNRSSSSVKILSDISLPPFRPSMSSFNSAHTQQSSQSKCFVCFVRRSAPHFGQSSPSPPISITYLGISLIPHLFFSILFVAPFESNQAGVFFSSGNGRSFGLNASPEVALSPSISSVATSASEVSQSVYQIIYTMRSYLKKKYNCNGAYTENIPT